MNQIKSEQEEVHETYRRELWIKIALWAAQKEGCWKAARRADEVLDSFDRKFRPEPK